MKIFIQISTPEKIFFLAWAKLNDALFEASHEVYPGEEFAGHSFEELLSLGLGEHEISEKE